MKRALFLAALFLFVSIVQSFSQDVIFRKDGTREEVKVVLVSEKEIQYKKYSNPDGPVYSVGKRDISVITYENGEYEVINKVEGDKPAKNNLSQDFAKNIISYHMFDVVFGDFTLSYERLVSNGKVGFRIPVSIGYDYLNDNYNFSSKYYSGIGVSFYPIGQGKWRFFVGPQVRYGVASEKESYWYWYYDEDGNYVEEYEETESEGFYTQFFLDNGLVYMPLRDFSVSVVGSLGIRYFPESAYDYDVVRPDGWFAVNIGYRF